VYAGQLFFTVVCLEGARVSQKILTGFPPVLTGSAVCVVGCSRGKQLPSQLIPAPRCLSDLDVEHIDAHDKIFYA